MGGRPARKVGQLRRKHWIFSGAVSSGAGLGPLSSVAVQGCPKVSESPGQERSCFVSFLHSKERQKGKKKKKGQAPSRRWIPTSLSPSSCLIRWPPRVAVVSMLPPASDPPHLSAHWTYQKFQIFKAVSVCSVYMLGFKMVHGQKMFSTSHTWTLARCLFLASLYFVGPTQTATLKYSAQPYHGRTPRPCRYRG